MLRGKEFLPEGTRLEYLKIVFVNFGISDLKEGKLLNFGKKKQQQIFERNSAQNYFSVTKFHMKRLKYQKKFSMILEFFDFK